MANGVHKAPTSSLGEIAELYLQGQYKVYEAGQAVQKMRNEELENLGAQLDQISLTGLQDADKMYNQAGVILRQRIAQAHEDNRRGLISKSEATRITNQAIADANMIVNSTEIIGQNYEDLKKKVDDGEWSGASLDQFTSGYFGMQRNMSSNAAKRITLLSDSPSGLAFVHTYQYFDKDGKLHVNKLEAPLHNSINPNSAEIAAFDVFDWTKDISSAIGDRAMQMRGSNIPMNQGQTQVWVRDHASDPQVVETIESMIDGFTDMDLIGVLYDGLGARAQWSNSYGGEKDAAALAKLLTENGEARYFDRDGNPIDFIASGNDHWTLATNMNNKGVGTTEYVLTDEQRELARAYLRKTAWTSLDIDYRNIRDTERSGRSSTGGASNTKFTPFNFTGVKTPNFTSSRNVLGQLHLMGNFEGQGIMMLESEDFAKAISTTHRNETRERYENQMVFDPGDVFSTTGAKQNSYTKEGWEAFGRHWLGEDGWNTIDDYSNTTNYTVNLFQNDANNFTTVLQGGTNTKKPKFNLRTIEGNKFTDINQLGYASYIDPVTKEERITLVVTGESEFIKKKTKVPGSEGGTSIAVDQSEITPTFGYLSSNNAKKLYHELYANYTQFADAAGTLGFDQDPTKAAIPNGDKINDKYAYAVMKILESFK